MEQFTYRDVYLLTEVLKDCFGIFTLTYYVTLCLKLKRTNGADIFFCILEGFSYKWYIAPHMIDTFSIVTCLLKINELQ